MTEANGTVAVLKETAVKTLLILLQCNHKKNFLEYFLFSFWLFCNFYLKGANIKALIRRCNRLACLSPQPSTLAKPWQTRRDPKTLISYQKKVSERVQKMFPFRLVNVVFSSGNVPLDKVLQNFFDINNALA